MRLGILGGTFDPIHFGHLRLAEEAAEALELEKIYLIPAALPPHKEGRTVTSFRHRFEMARIACRESPVLGVLDLEARREGLSYSIETLKEFHRLFGSSLDLFFILGMDAFLEIGSWKEHQHLLDYAHFVVIKRPGVPSFEAAHVIEAMGPGFKKGEKECLFRSPSGYRLIYKEFTLLDISSTQIRKCVASGKTIRYLTPPDVKSYIEVNRLYQTDENQ